MAESQYPVAGTKVRQSGSCGFYWVLITRYFYLLFVHLPSMTGVQLVPSDDISNLNV
jgi:hypothetical protein